MSNKSELCGQISRRKFLSKTAFISSGLIFLGTLDDFVKKLEPFHLTSKSGLFRVLLSDEKPTTETVPVYPQAGWIYGDLTARGIEWPQLFGFDDRTEDVFGPEKVIATVAVNNPIVHAACQKHYQKEIDNLGKQVVRPRLGDVMHELFETCFEEISTQPHYRLASQEDRIRAALDAAIFTYASISDPYRTTDDAINTFKLNVSPSQRAKMRNLIVLNFLDQNAKIEPANPANCDSPADQIQRCDGVYDRNTHTGYHAVAGLIMLQAINGLCPNMWHVPKIFKEVLKDVHGPESRARAQSIWIGKPWEIYENYLAEKNIASRKWLPSIRDKTGSRSWDNQNDLFANQVGVEMAIAFSKINNLTRLGIYFDYLNSDEINLPPKPLRISILGFTIDVADYISPELRWLLSPLVRLPEH